MTEEDEEFNRIKQDYVRDIKTPSREALLAEVAVLTEMVRVLSARVAEMEAKQEQGEPVAWPCHIIEADFSERTITLGMECGDYKVSAGQHWLHTTPPAAQPAPVPLTDELSNAVKMACQCSYMSHGRRTVNEQAWQRLMQAVAACAHGIATTPPAAQRTWVGLKDPDFSGKPNTPDFIAGAFFAEAILKEKNT